MTGCFPIAALPGDSALRAHGGEMSRSAHGRGIAIIRRSEWEDLSRTIRGGSSRPGIPGPGSSPCPGGSSGRKKPVPPIPWLLRNPPFRKRRNILCFQKSRRHPRSQRCRKFLRNRKSQKCRNARNALRSRKSQKCRSARNARSVLRSRKSQKYQSARSARSIHVRPVVPALARLAASQ